MGYYINPRNGSAKEIFLKEKATALGLNPPNSEDIDWDKKDVLPVVLLDNVVFTAAGVAYSPSELKMMADPSDKRFKLWFLVETKYLGWEAGFDPEEVPW